MSIIHTFKDHIFSFKMNDTKGLVLPIFLTKLRMIMWSHLGNF